MGPARTTERSPSAPPRSSGAVPSLARSRRTWLRATRSTSGTNAARVAAGCGRSRPRARDRLVRGRRLLLRRPARAGLRRGARAPGDGTRRGRLPGSAGCPPRRSRAAGDADRILLDAIDSDAAAAIAAYGERLATLVEDPTAVLDGPLPEPDRRLRDDPAILWMWRESLRESARQGVVGWAWETAAVHRPWVFRLEDVRVPVRVWHGRRDTIVPVEHARYLGDHLQNAKVTVWPDAGHGGLVMHWRDVLMAIRQPRADESRR